MQTHARTLTHTHTHVYAHIISTAACPYASTYRAKPKMLSYPPSEVWWGGGEGGGRVGWGGVGWGWGREGCGRVNERVRSV